MIINDAIIDAQYTHEATGIIFCIFLYKTRLTNMFFTSTGEAHEDITFMQFFLLFKKICIFKKYWLFNFEFSICCYIISW